MPKIKTKSGAKKRFKMTGTGKVLYAQSRQAPRHDQADQEADPPAARHQRAVQDRRRQHQEVLPAQRLTGSWPARGRHSRCSVLLISGDQPWHASSAASQPTPSTRRSSRPPRAIYGRRKNTIRVAKQAVEKANQYAYRDRKRKKRTFRALWIQRLNAAVRPFGLNYSRFIDGLEQGRRHGRPQGAVRPRHPRAGGVRGDRREGQGGARSPLPEAGIHVRTPCRWRRGRAHRSERMIDRLCAAHGALQSLAEREPLRRRRRLVGRRAPARARRVLRLDPQDAEPPAVGRPASG